MQRCITNAGRLIKDQVNYAMQNGQPPIVLLGEQEHQSAGREALQEGLGPDWTALDSRGTCQIWYHNKLLSGVMV